MHSARNNTPVGGLETIMMKWQDLDSLGGHVGLGIPRNYIKAFLELHQSGAPDKVELPAMDHWSSYNNHYLHATYYI